MDKMHYRCKWFEVDLIKHPLFCGKNNIKSEKEKLLRQQIVGEYREKLQTFG